MDNIVPSKGATAAGQQEGISLLESLNNLVNLLAPLAAAMNSGQPALRVVQAIAPPTTPVSGTVTATVANATIAGITGIGGISAYPFVVAQLNLLPALSNINNVTV